VSDRNGSACGPQCYACQLGIGGVHKGPADPAEDVARRLIFEGTMALLSCGFSKQRLAELHIAMAVTLAFGAGCTPDQFVAMVTKVTEGAAAAAKKQKKGGG
jgi:hypothetical protein